MINYFCQPLPFPITPLPAWVRTFDCYTYEIPTDGAQIKVIKLFENGAILPRPHIYEFGEHGCMCQEERSGIRHTPYCRHEQAVWVIRKYLTCYRCGRGPDILAQFELRQTDTDNERARTGQWEIACLLCEEELKRLGYTGLQVLSSCEGWHGKPLEPAEYKLLSKIFDSLRAERNGKTTPRSPPGGKSRQGHNRVPMQGNG